MYVCQRVFKWIFVIPTHQRTSQKSKDEIFSAPSMEAATAKDSKSQPADGIQPQIGTLEKSQGERSVQMVQIRKKKDGKKILDSLIFSAQRFLKYEHLYLQTIVDGVFCWLVVKKTAPFQKVGLLKNPNRRFFFTQGTRKLNPEVFGRR